MTILEQILAGLQQKFTGVDTATLTRIATKKAEGVTDGIQVNSIVEGISFQDVMQNYGDFRAGQAQTSAVSNYEKKHSCLLYTSPSPRDRSVSRMPSSA